MKSQLEKIRKARGLSRYRLSKLTGLAESHLRSIELGLIKSPTFDVAQRIASALAIPADQLFGEKKRGAA